MATPSISDIEAKRKKREGFLKLLDDDGRMPEKRLVSMIRTALRQAWMKAPNKLAKIEQERISDMDSNTRTKWLFKCKICNKKFKLTDIHVDHIIGGHEFTEMIHMEKYCTDMLNVPIDELQILCIPCHHIKTLAESRGIPFEEARYEKKILEFTTLKAKAQIKILAKHNLAGKNATIRETLIRQVLDARLAKGGKL